jgi:hypothetical protein
MKRSRNHNEIETKRTDVNAEEVFEHLYTLRFDASKGRTFISLTIQSPGA